METQTDAGTTVEVEESDNYGQSEDVFTITVDGTTVFSGTEEAIRGMLNFYIDPVAEAVEELLDELTRSGPYLVGEGDKSRYGFAIPVSEITSDNLIITEQSSVNDFAVSFDSSVECSDKTNFGGVLHEHKPAAECDAHVRADEISIQLDL